MLTEYLSYLEQKGKSLNTIISYRNDMNKFFEDIHIHPEDYVTASDVRKWVRKWLYGLLQPKDGKSLAVTTINRRLNALRSFYKWARRNNKISKAPAALLPFPRGNSHAFCVLLRSSHYSHIIPNYRLTFTTKPKIPHQQPYFSLLHCA